MNPLADKPSINFPLLATSRDSKRPKSTVAKNLKPDHSLSAHVIYGAEFGLLLRASFGEVCAGSRMFGAKGDLGTCMCLQITFLLVASVFSAPNDFPLHCRGKV